VLSKRGKKEKIRFFFHNNWIRQRKWPAPALRFVCYRKKHATARLRLYINSFPTEARSSLLYLHLRRAQAIVFKIKQPTSKKVKLIPTASSCITYQEHSWIIHWHLGCLTVSCQRFHGAFNLFFWSFNSNSTLKNPKQYNMIDNTEIIEANEGKSCFLTVISVISSFLNNPRKCYAQCGKVLLYTVSACYVILTSRVWMPSFRLFIAFGMSGDYFSWQLPRRGHS